jgi:hypothetical protein
VQIDYDVVHLRTSLVQLFVLLQLNFEEVVQIIELRRFGGAPNGYPLQPYCGRSKYVPLVVLHIVIYKKYLYLTKLFTQAGPGLVVISKKFATEDAAIIDLEKSC